MASRLARIFQERSLSSSHSSNSVDMGIAQTSLRKIPRELLLSGRFFERGRWCSWSSFAVAKKSHSSPLTLSSRSTVEYHTLNPPLRLPSSPAKPTRFGPGTSSSGPSVVPPRPPRLLIHASRKVSPGTLQTRSQGKRRKSPTMLAWTWGRRRSSAVAVSWVRSAGARMEGEGAGREVRYGFCARAAERVAWDSGGVIRVMSAGC